MRKTLALFIILLAILMACSNNKDDSSKEEENPNNREKLATLKEVYGEVKEIGEKVGPITSITVPEGTTFHADGSTDFTFRFKDDKNIPAVDAHDNDKSLTVGEIMISGRINEEPSYPFEKLMELVERRMSGNIHGDRFDVLDPDLTDHPELIGFNAYRFSNHNGVMIFKLFKQSEYDESYVEIGFAMYETAYSVNKLRAIHEIISSMEYEL